MTWFHGAPEAFDAFDHAFVGRGNDQLGSGFYFTDRRDTAAGYARGGVVIVAELELSNPLPDACRIEAAWIRALVMASPTRDDVLQDFGDVESGGLERVVRYAVSSYSAMTDVDLDPLPCLNCISNDFYRGREGEFLRSLHRITGFDGLVREVGAERHAVAWLPDSIRVLGCEATHVSVISP